MNRVHLQELLMKFKEGLLNLEEITDALKLLPFEDLGFAKVDHHRALRNGFPEVIFCPGKTPGQVQEIFRTLAKASGTVLATRATEEIYGAVSPEFPEAVYHPLARAIVLNPPPREEAKGKVLVISAGTADLPVAEEAALTAEVMGNRVERLYDVGVAGLHRLLAHQELLLWAQVIIVVAGMEGALASVVGGLTQRPVIAVPTSIGYGSSFQGLAALLGMLNTCATGVGVVNIDNGFGAGALAHAITRAGGELS